MNYRRNIAAVFAAAFSCVGCSGYIVKNITPPHEVSDRADGAVVGYYQPKAVWKFTAGYDGATGLLSLSADPKPTTLPDTDSAMKYLSYAHSGISDDDIDIQMDGLMLKLVASKSSDQTVKIVEAANTLLTEVGTARTTFQKANLISYSLTADSGPPQPLKDARCTATLKSEVTVNMSSLTHEPQRDLQWGEYCSLAISISAKLLGIRPFKTVSNQSSPFAASQTLGDTEGICERAVCFRPTQIVEVTIGVSLLSNSIEADGLVKRDDKKQPVYTPNGKSYVVRIPKAGSKEPAPLVLSQRFNPVAVPSARAGQAFVEFGRRAFVENHTSIQFADGVVSEFKSTDPSIIAGAITLSSDLLKTVVLTVPIVR
jgi:hypothetical protein